ncbi:HNH endonuclease [Clostridium sp. D2Q-11]|uniref:HNH endonuclease n=1 Tax=Anaeromonas frigoriresistens TaxID=2683708 RepID=A0A942V1X2_9FIRM|nr:HNH endonuclease signature motif containing protein [Anaeromonas frigoriresistens]MBS4539652.1 HNH endonuclease [Anaeromonas frigoriresistens]
MIDEFSCEKKRVRNIKRGKELPYIREKLLLKKSGCDICGFQPKNKQILELHQVKSHEKSDVYNTGDYLLVCPNCHKKIHIDTEGLNRLGDEFDIEFKENEVEDFIEHIYYNPMVAYKHIIGEKIYNLLKKCYKKNYFETVQPSMKLYRGRKRKKYERQYSKKQLWSPPSGLASHGRYNSVGVSVLYCSDLKDSIPYEIHPQVGDIIDIGEFTVERELKVLNINNIFNEFEGFISVENTENKLVNRCYLFTNYIRDCCNIIGYNGIIYNGVTELDYNNFAFTNLKKHEDIEIKSVKSIEYKNNYIAITK